MQQPSGNRFHKSTEAVHDSVDTRHHGAVKTPIYQNSLFTFATYQEFEQAMQDTLGNYVYSRGGNPTVNVLEQLIATLEGGEKAKCFASGMAAITAAILSTAKAGDHVICVDQAYGPARDLLGTYLPQFGIETTFVDGTSIARIQDALRKNTVLLYLESPSTLFFQLQDLRACADLANRAGITTIMDNTWATPMFQNPLKLGIHLVVHSTSKYIGGHSDAVGGVVVGSKEAIRKLSEREYMLFGGIMTPHIADLTTRGVRTLPIRMAALQQTAQAMANFLQSLPYVRVVNYPGLVSHPQHSLALSQMQGFGSLMSFETDLPAETMKSWANSLQLLRIGVSWGGYESLVTVQPLREGSIVRLYFGLENQQDLMDDISNAFAGLTI